MMQLNDYESLNREERLRRVCTLLAKAVTLACIREQAANGDAAPIPAARKNPGPVVTAEVENRDDLQSGDLALLREIHRWGEISPRDASLLWSVSRATTQRRLSRLELAGWIARHGSTSATRYRLTEQASPLLSQVSQAMQAPDAPQGGQ